MPIAAITISGNLTADPEMRFTPGGHAVCNFTVAYTPRERDASGEWKDGDVQYWNVAAWRALGENIAESLVRGDPVIVSGTVRFRQYVTKEGEKRHAHEITADSVGVSLAFHTVRVRRSQRSSKTESDTSTPAADASAPADAGTESGSGLDVFAGK
jgi:single-strand DNA-binding protein